MSHLASRLFRHAACAFAVALPLLLGSCSSSSSTKMRGVPARLPVIDLQGSSSTPSHSMSRADYPFDSGGNYVTAWASEGEQRAGRGAGTSSDYAGWKSSHHGEGSRKTLSKPTKVASTSTSSKAKSKSTASTSKKAGASTSKKATGSRSHAVKSGDTLSSIARKYGTTVSKIKAANALQSDMIRDGRSLTIPR